MVISAPYKQEYPIVRRSLDMGATGADALNSASNENTPGALQSFTIGPQGVLNGPHDQISSQGGSPAYNAPLSGGQVAIMNVRLLHAFSSVHI